MENTFPTVAVCLFMTVILLVYLDKVKAIFAAHPISPDRELDDEQIERFAPFEHAVSLQLATNRWHNQAIKAKSSYETVGVIACSAAPALIILSAASPGLEAVGLASDRGVTIAQGIVCAMVLFIICGFRHPTKPHVEKRLRTELLRCHLHCLLARVGPYSADESVAAQVESDAATLNPESIAARLRDLEQQCIRQAEGTDPLSSEPVFSVECADAYILERVGEQLGDASQEGYFLQAAERLRQAYKYSARAVFAVIFLATLVGAIRVFAPGLVDPDLAYFLYASFGALAVLIVALRSVFGWDSKAGLYVRQARELHNLVEELNSARDEIASGDENAVPTFRCRAAAFEALMAHEACDWKLITDREYYDVTP